MTTPALQDIQLGQANDVQAEPIFRTGVVVLVLATPEFLFLAVWLWVRQGAAHVGLSASLLAVECAYPRCGLFSESRPQASVTVPDTRRSVKTQGYGGVIAAEHTHLIGPQTSHELQKLVWECQSMTAQ